MTVTIRKLDNTEHDYFAYTKSLCGKAIYFVHFQDTIWRVVNLNNFVEMLRLYFQQSKVDVKFEEKGMTIKNESILKLLIE